MKRLGAFFCDFPSLATPAAPATPAAVPDVVTPIVAQPEQPSLMKQVQI